MKEGRPTAVALPASILEKQFPFHVLFERDLSIVSAGQAVHRILDADSGQRRISEILRIDHPAGCGWTFEEIGAHQEAVFILAGRSNPLLLKASMNYLPDSDRFLMLASPWVKSSDDIQQQRIRWADFPIHDPTPDCLFLMQIQETSLADMKRLSEEVRIQADRLKETNELLTAANQALTTESESRRDAEERFHRCVAAARDVIAIVEGDGTIRSLNDYYKELTGVPASRRIGQFIERIIWPGGIPAARRIFEGLASGKSMGSFELRLVTATGTYITAEFTATELLESGIGQARLLVGRDVTKRNEISRLKDELISTVSHELRTPLTSMRGFVELLLARAYTKERTREILSILKTETARLERLVTDFLDVKKIEVNGLDLQLGRIELLSVIEQQIILFEGSGGGRTIVNRLPQQLPAVIGDAGAVARIVSNLLSNASKFSAPDGPIEVTARETGAQVEVSVMDHGIGIPKDAIDQIFEPFWRMNNSSTRNVGGTGLGLTLVKELVEKQNGEIWVDSIPGQGSVFHFTLPVAGQ